MAKRFNLGVADNTASELSSMVYSGRKPWHNCGQAVPPDLPWQDVPSLDPIGYSDRELRPLQYPAIDAGIVSMLDVPDQMIVVRTADNRAMGIVGSKYGLIQPQAVIGAMAQVADVAGAKLTTAGFLRNGNVQWAQAKVPGLGFRIPIGTRDNPASILEENLTMFNSFDGSLAFTAGGAATDIVCQNTFMHALREVGRGNRSFTIRHNAGASVALGNMVQEMTAMRQGFESFAQMATKLAETAMSKADFVEFIAALVPDPVDTSKSPARAEAKRAQLLDAWGNAPGQTLDGKRNTAWGALSAVTFFTTWQAPADNDSNRWYNATLGKGADLADSAMQTLRLYAGA